MHRSLQYRYFGESEISQEVSYKVQESEEYLEIENHIVKQDFTIFFETNSNRLSNQEIIKLNRVAQIILGFSNYQIQIDGYTDSLGDYEYNKTISLNRAAVAKSYLVGRGVKPQKIEFRGHGPVKFLASNNTAKGRKRNRRVKITLFIIEPN